MAFILQAHRGARNRHPENTLPAFEAALDLGVSSIETDLHLTADGVPVVLHDPAVTERLCRLAPGNRSPDPATRPPVASLTLTQLRGYRADRNPDPVKFPDQDPTPTPLAKLFGEHHEIDPLTPPSLADLLAFVVAYAGSLGTQAGKTPGQQTHARHVNLDLEIKRVPFHPEYIVGDLEREVLHLIRASGLVDRITVRSFDHRCVRRLRQEEPALTAAVLISWTAPVNPARLAQEAKAQIYCPELEFLDRDQVAQCHDAGIKVLPWTVNEPRDWERVLDMGVDGVTTDFPDRLAAWLAGRRI